MPALGFGTCCRESARGEPLVASVKAYLALGGRHVDTAQLYGNHAELGRAILESHAPREELWITSKVKILPRPDHAGRTDAPAARTASDALGAVDSSLRELRLDYLDLMLLHHPSQDASEREAAWRGLIEAQRQGKVRNIGVSQYTVGMIQELERATGVLPAVNQIMYHPWAGAQQREIVDWCREKGIVVTAFFSLKGANQPFKQEAVAKIASRHAATPSQVLLRWALDQGVVVIPGATSEDHIRENLYLEDFHLDAADLATLGASP
jgi:diketogulonate reductase-like aldo/keto reductase